MSKPQSKSRASSRFSGRVFSIKEMALEIASLSPCKILPINPDIVKEHKELVRTRKQKKTGFDWIEECSLAETSLKKNNKPKFHFSFFIFFIEEPNKRQKTTTNNFFPPLSFAKIIIWQRLLKKRLMCLNSRLMKI
ncbi:MAG: hypothetical protein Q8P67_19530 [archaeon]|nr:hypothetical protein [archaeon]